MTIEALRLAGALIGPTSDGNWLRLIAIHGADLVLTVVRAIHTTTHQLAVVTTDVERVLDRLARDRALYGEAFLEIPAAIQKAIGPARPIPPSLPRLIPPDQVEITTADQAKTPAAKQSWISAERVLGRITAQMAERKLSQQMVAAAIGVSPYTLARLLEGVNTRGPQARTLTRILEWLDRCERHPIKARA